LFTAPQTNHTKVKSLKLQVLKLIGHRERGTSVVTFPTLLLLSNVVHE